MSNDGTYICYYTWKTIKVKHQFHKNIVFL